MKKYFVSAALITLIAACGGGDSTGTDKDTTSATTTPATTDVSENPDYKAGSAIVGQLDCSTCHRVSERVLGPSFKEIAQKYAGVDTAVTYLSKKIIKGGNDGVWGIAGTMTPHETLSQDSAAQIVKYILLLKDMQ